MALSALTVAGLDAKKARHDEVTLKLQDPDTPSRDIDKLARELGSLATLVEAHTELQEVETGIAELEALLETCDDTEDGRDMAAMAQEELSELRERVEPLEMELKRLLVPKDEADDRSVIIECRAGAGGEEAALFAADMFRMYERFAQRQGYRFEPLTASKMDSGGFREASAAIKGAGVFGALKYESGVHRVQRVPATESGGRTHTSTATIAVLPEAEEVDVDIKPADIRVDTYRARGAGGQHVNTTDSAVRITHLETGLVVAIQDERSQMQNKTKAMRVLRARLFEQQRNQAAQDRADTRRAQIGTGDRSERVRTYNYLQDRVTDHRVSLSKFGITAMLDGEFLPEFTDVLRTADEAAAMEEFE